MFIKIKDILLTHLMNPQPKTIFVLVFLFGILLLIVYGIHKRLGHIKMAKREYEILQKRGMIGDAYTASLDEELSSWKKESRQMRIEESSEKKKDLFYPKVQVDKEKPIQLDIADYETSLLDETEYMEQASRDDSDESGSYATTLL